MVDIACDDKYAHERTKPTVTNCMPAGFKLIFDGVKIQGVWTNDLMFYPAVSGKPDGDGRFNYSKKRQKISNLGPIPEGNYWINPEELQENAWWRFRNPRDAWGNYWITIHVYPETNTYERGGFFIHGGSAEGSAGCIDLTHHMKDFVSKLRSELKIFNCYIPLEVRYAR